MPVSLPNKNDETRRLEALRRYEILDTPAEQAFDDFAFLASTVCQTPIAMMTFVDNHRQWFKARLGVNVAETPREGGFCTHTILGKDVMIVEDATSDQRFANHPLVTAAPHIRFYAGVPLIDGEGNGLGSLCVIDHHRRSLTLEQNKALQALARQIISQLELRRASAELAKAFSDIKTLRGLLPICAHCKGIRNDTGFWQSVESYVMSHSAAKFSHGVCPKCLKLHFPEIYEQLLAEGKVSQPNP